MHALLVASLLACPPTTVSKREPPDHVGYYLANPYGWMVIDEPAQPTSEPPEPRDLPLADLAATRAALGSSEDDAWLRWLIDLGDGKPASAQAALVEALSADTLSAERMLWWLAHAPANGDARDALSDAYDRSDAPRTKLLLAIALTLAHGEASCPVELGPDGACRMPDSSIALEHDLLLRRDGLALERANEWERRARKLAKRAKIDPSELAMHALLAEFELASMSEDYESVLVARVPEELSFVLEEYLHDSGVADWERIYAKQVERAQESRKRYGAFAESEIGCLRDQSERQDRVKAASANVSLKTLLRQAKLLLAFAETLGVDPQTRRADQRKWQEHHERTWSYIHPGQDFDVKMHAIAMAEQCVEIGTTIGGAADLLAACFELLETHDDWRHVPLAELVPAPAARTTTMHAIGVSPL